MRRVLNFINIGWFFVATWRYKDFQDGSRNLQFMLRDLYCHAILLPRAKRCDGLLTDRGTVRKNKSTPTYLQLRAPTCQYPCCECNQTTRAWLEQIVTFRYKKHNCRKPASVNTTSMGSLSASLKKIARFVGRLVSGLRIVADRADIVFIHALHKQTQVKKGKSRCIYISLIFVSHARLSGMDHTVLPAITPMPVFTS